MALEESLTFQKLIFQQSDGGSFWYILQNLNVTILHFVTLIEVTNTQIVTHFTESIESRLSKKSSREVAGDRTGEIQCG